MPANDTIRSGPSVARVAALIGDPARAHMLAALMDGRALTASELAHAAGVTAQTASAHLAKLREGGLIDVASQGRHRYMRLAGADVARALEALMGVAARAGDGRVRTGPREPAMRRARVCYDHLAGDAGVRLFDSLAARGYLVEGKEDVRLTPSGAKFVRGFGVDLDALEGAKRPLCRPCLDWSLRRTHLAGALGAALLDEIFARGWASRQRNARTVIFTAAGERAFNKAFPL